MKNKLLFLLVALMLIATISALVGCSTTPTISSTDSSQTSDVETTEADTTATDESTPNDGSSAPDTAEPTPDSSTDDSSVTTPAPDTSSEPVSETSAPSDTDATPAVTTTAETTKTPEDTTPEPPRGTKIKVIYEINNPYAGSLVGSTTQLVNYGITSTSAVTVTTNLGYKFVGWSDGSINTTRSGECPKENTTYTAIFEYDSLELPIISLFTDNGLDITDKENYVTGKISVYNAPEDFCFEDLAMEIRGRGNYTWNSTFNADPLYNKRPYRVKLSEKMNLLGQGNGKAKSWVLIANHCDQSLLRNQTVMNFAKSLPGIVWEPSASSVEVFLNGEYIGVYMLAEQVQINKNRINLSEDVESSAEIDFLLHRSGYAYNEPDNIAFTYDGEPYEIVSDLSTDRQLYSKQFQYIQSRIGECWDAVKYGTEEEIRALIDINSVIDTMIVHELFKNLDTGHDNFYMFASVDSKLFFGPVWDFDQCAGNADVGVENYEGLRGSYENNWYENFLKHDWYKELFLNRWDELYADEIQEIPEYIRSHAKAAYNSYCRNFDKWTILGYTDEHGNKQLGYKINREMEHIRIFQTYDEHYEYFAQWMENRMVWLNNYYHSSQFIVIKVDLNLSGKGTANAPYLINSAEDFYNFTQVMAQGETFAGKYFKQTADIDMTSITYYMGVGAPNAFAGIYDGCGHKIHVNINGGTDTNIFPYVTGTIMNLMTTGSISNSGHAGGIARSIRVGGLIVNCASTVSLSSSGGNAGGIVPSNENTGGSIIGCWFGGSINTNNSFGPINVYVEGRTYGTIKYNYYNSDFCTPDRLSAASIQDGESAISANQVGTLHIVMGRNLEDVVTAAQNNGANIQASDLCSWKASDDGPVLVTK